MIFELRERRCSRRRQHDARTGAKKPPGEAHQQRASAHSRDSGGHQLVDGEAVAQPTGEQLHRRVDPEEGREDKSIVLLGKAEVILHQRGGDADRAAIDVIEEDGSAEQQHEPSRILSHCAIHGPDGSQSSRNVHKVRTDARWFEARMNARSSTCTRSRQHGVAQRADIHAAKQSEPYFASVMFSESRMSASTRRGY